MVNNESFNRDSLAAYVNGGSGEIDKDIKEEEKKESVQENLEELPSRE